MAESIVPNRGVVSAQVENDLFGSGRDDNYTNGLQLTYSSARLDRLPRFRDLIRALGERLEPLPLTADADNCDVQYRYTVRVGQKMFTPRDISTPDLQLDDRPYAGWTFVSLGMLRDLREGHNFGSLDAVELDLGIVGPASGARYVQTRWHDLIGVPRPRGWDHQLENEPGVVLRYERVWRNELFHDERRSCDGFSSDFMPHLGISLGNVYLHGALGAAARVGWGLCRDYGAPRIRPGVGGSDYFAAGRGAVSLYAFVGLEGRVVGRDIFLDGNTFRDSHSVDKRRTIGELHSGLVLAFDGVRLSFSQVVRTREFDAQSQATHFGLLNLAVRL